jgi:anionic cell wall polymer biosynthesis LytR-Cps2A-Psr (LCP) family protein
MTPKENKTQKSNKLKYLLPILLILGFVIWASSSLMFKKSGEDAGELTKSGVESGKDLSKDSAFIKATQADEDTTEKIIKMSSPLNSNYEGGYDEQAGKNVKCVYDGRRINIAVIGLDARVGTVSNHADANHILSIMPDKGIIEITSIPRDTPADAGMPDSTGQNKLTIVRAMKGRQAYLREAAKIAGLDKIPYYVEVGFSQVMGILELLGYSDSKSALQVLRSRKGLGGDDFQRSYNQGQFIRQTMLRHFSKTTGTLGDLLIRGGLALVETNLTADITSNIVESLEKNGFGDNPEDVTIKVRPPMGMKFKVYDFSNKEVVNGLQHKIEGFNVKNGAADTKPSDKFNVSSKLWSAIHKAAADSARKPQSVIASLELLYSQRAWLQVENKDDRAKIRDSFETLLVGAYTKKKQNDKAKKVKEAIEKEKQLFQKQIFN